MNTACLLAKTKELCELIRTQKASSEPKIPDRNRTDKPDRQITQDASGLLGLATSETDLQRAGWEHHGDPDVANTDVPQDAGSMVQPRHDQPNGGVNEGT